MNYKLLVLAIRNWSAPLGGPNLVFGALLTRHSLGRLFPESVRGCPGSYVFVWRSRVSALSQQSIALPVVRVELNPVQTENANKV